MTDRIKKAEEVLKQVLDKYGAKIEYEISFPQYRQYPDEVKLALKILERHGMKVTIILKEKT